jgi:hypothetical protein
VVSNNSSIKINSSIRPITPKDSFSLPQTKDKSSLTKQSTSVKTKTSVPTDLEKKESSRVKISLPVRLETPNKAVSSSVLKGSPVSLGSPDKRSRSAQNPLPPRERLGMTFSNNKKPVSKFEFNLKAKEFKPNFKK